MGQNIIVAWVVDQCEMKFNLFAPNEYQDAQYLFDTLKKDRQVTELHFGYLVASQT